MQGEGEEVPVLDRPQGLLLGSGVWGGCGSGGNRWVASSCPLTFSQQPPSGHMTTYSGAESANPG